MTGSFADERFRNRSTKEGWEHFVSELPPRVEPISLKQLKKLSPEEREYFAQLRRRHTAAAGIVRTPQLSTTMLAVEKCLVLNEHKAFGKHGIIVSGEPGLGKTTIVTQIGRIHTLTRRAQSHPAGTPGNIPVMYITVPPACGPKAMLMEFADFFGIPTAGRLSQQTLMNSVVSVMAALHVELVIVDEIHNLNMNYKMGADSSDMLKQLSEKTRATYVFAGVRVDTSGLLDGDRGEQIASRFELHRITEFSMASKARRDEWDDVLLGMEATLLLVNQTPGDILAHSTLLYSWTEGSFVKLSWLLHGCALMAIDTGQERITERILRANKPLELNPQHRAAS